MNGNEVYIRAVSLLGLSGDSETIVVNVVALKSDLDLINQIALDLKIPEVKSIYEDFKATEAEIEALVYGTAMLLSLSGQFSEKNQLFTEIYNAKRAAVLNEITTVKDNLPVVDFG